MKRITHYFQCAALTPTQRQVDAAKIQGMVVQGPPSLALHGKGPLPLVIEEEGRFLLVDGHHRRLWHQHYDEPMLCQVLDREDYRDRSHLRMNGRRKMIASQ